MSDLYIVLAAAVGSSIGAPVVSKLVDGLGSLITRFLSKKDKNEEEKKSKKSKDDEAQKRVLIDIFGNENQLNAEIYQSDEALRNKLKLYKEFFLNKEPRNLAELKIRAQPYAEFFLAFRKENGSTNISLEEVQLYFSYMIANNEEKAHTASYQKIWDEKRR